MKIKPEFIFNANDIEGALRANGWRDLWHPDNWVHEDSTDPDHSGTDIMSAFKVLLRSKNLI